MGPELIQIYNDGYRPSLGWGGRHPRALGMRGEDFWTDIWDIIGPQIEAVMRRGESTWHEDQLVAIERNGRLEEVYWTYGYSPVRDDDGSVGGTLVVCQETTSRVLGERRRATLHALATLPPHPDPASTAVAAAEVMLADGRDVPFGITFLSDQAGGSATLSHTSLPAGSPLLDPARWPIDEVLRSDVMRWIELPPEDGVGVGPWPEAPSAAALVPLRHSSGGSPHGVLVVGLSPRLPWDDAYQDFVRAAGRTLATHLANRQGEAERAGLLRAPELERARLAELFRQAPSFLAVLPGPSPVQLARTEGGPPEERFLDFVFQPLTETDGSRSGVVAHGTDVTDHVHARSEIERLLARAEEARRPPRSPTARRRSSWPT